MEKYYVVMTRIFKDSAINTLNVAHDEIMIFDFQEALKHRWINENGERIWIFEPDSEGRCITFVYEFDDLEQAIVFYETLSKNELDIKTVEA